MIVKLLFWAFLAIHCGFAAAKALNMTLDAVRIVDAADVLHLASASSDVNCGPPVYESVPGLQSDCSFLIQRFQTVFFPGGRQANLSVPAHRCLRMDYGKCGAAVCNTADVLSTSLGVREQSLVLAAAYKLLTACIGNKSRYGIWSDDAAAVILFMPDELDADDEERGYYKKNKKREDESTDRNVAPLAADSTVDLSECPNWAFGEYVCCKTTNLKWSNCLKAIRMMDYINPNVQALITVPQNGCISMASGGCRAELCSAHQELKLDLHKVVQIMANPLNDDCVQHDHGGAVYLTDSGVQIALVPE